MERINEFIESMAANGLQCPDTIVSDGVLHRFNVNGDKPGNKNGWYVFYGNDGLPAGAFGSWKLGQTFTWCGKEEKTFTDAERAKWRKRIAEAKKARDEELKRIHFEAQKRAQAEWEKAKPVKKHPYLNIKGVKSYSLREDNKGRLVIPIRDIEGTLHSLQTIDGQGNKLFLPGGAIAGHFSSIDGTGNTLLICEGYSTGASLHEATGYPVVVAFNAGNLKAAAEALRKKSPGTNIIICGDDDYQTEENPGITKGKEAAQAVGAVLVVPKFKDQAHRGTDFNDLHQVEGLEAVRLQIEEAKDGHSDPPLDVAQKTAEHLASLSPFMYEQQRVSMAKELNVRISTLDAEVEKIRRANNPEKTKSLVEELEPWPEPVTGGELLDTIHKVVVDYVIMPAKSAIAFSLWCLLTYCYNAFRILTILGIVSPEKRCGKTRLLEVLSGLAYRAFPSSNLTPATVYRIIEKCRPCFLIDEADTFLPNNEELRGVLNSGHSVKNAFVTRINPDTMEPERFSTWGPKAIALIGRLSGTLSTLEDRSICISLKRKLFTETVKRLGLDFDDECLDLRRKCKRWATDNMERLKAANPQLPDVNNDRALDNWTPLVAIADLASGEWPKKARDAMVKIEAAKEDDSARVMLIQDIQKIFEDRKCRALWTRNLIEALVKMEDRPWSEWKKGKPLSGASLALLLNPFEIKPGGIKQEDKNRNGYKLDQFKDVFKRYISLPTTPTSNQSSTPLPLNTHAAFREDQDSTSNKKVELQNGLKPAPIAKGRGVELQNRGTGEKDIKESDQVPEPLPKNDQDREVIPLW